MKSFGDIYLFILALGILVNLLSIFKFSSSSHSLLGVVYQVQIFMLIPLFNLDVGTDVIDFYRYIHDTLFTFNFMPNALVFLSKDDIFDQFRIEQDNWYLFLMDIENGSTLVNMTDLISVFLFIFAVSLAIIPFYF